MGALYVREIECSWNLELQKDMWPTQSLSRDGRRPALRIQFQYTLSIMHGVLGDGGQLSGRWRSNRTGTSWRSSTSCVEEKTYAGFSESFMIVAWFSFRVLMNWIWSTFLTEYFSMTYRQRLLNGKINIYISLSLRCSFVNYWTPIFCISQYKSRFRTIDDTRNISV